MSKTAHTIYIMLLGSIVLATLVLLILYGKTYYRTPLEERFYHEDHTELKPSGIIGHGLGIAGSFFMLVGVGSYMVRKRMKRFSRLGKLKHWLEFHIFLCTLGPILVLFHTSFKFGGLVAISFWSMVAVFASGVIGRFIYIQIPRTIEGREMSLKEIHEMKKNPGEIAGGNTEIAAKITGILDENVKRAVLDSSQKNLISSYFSDYRAINTLKGKLKKSAISKAERKRIVRLVRHEFSMNRKIGRLQLMQNLFRYWHVAHLPFAIVMLIIMIIHVAVTIIFGYRWIW
jgi:hypothetical protein